MLWLGPENVFIIFSISLNVGILNWDFTVELLTRQHSYNK